MQEDLSGEVKSKVRSKDGGGGFTHREGREECPRRGRSMHKNLQAGQRANPVLLMNLNLITRVVVAAEGF